MSASSSSSRRREMDVVKLMKSSRQFYPSDCISEFWVVFNGPEGTPYEEGTWVLHVLLPPEYPMKSPSIGFSNRILHPNVDEASGSVCLDVINQTWTPMYELKNIFDVFLPQLLRYPNPSDPLNATAAAYLQRDPTGYVTRVQEHVAVYATPEKALSCIPPPYGPQSLAAEDGNPCEEDANRNNNGCSDASACGDTTTNHNMLSDSSVTPTEKGIGASDAVGGVEEYVPEEIEI